jgi:hypothetical protein
LHFKRLILFFPLGEVALSLWEQEKRRSSPYATEVCDNLYQLWEARALGASLFVGKFARSLLEVAIPVANEQIKWCASCETRCKDTTIWRIMMAERMKKNQK